MLSLALGFAGVAFVLALLVATPAALVIATGRTCACAQPPDLVVQNADTRPITVTWTHDGLLLPGEPGAGTTDVAPCDSLTQAFPEGTVHVVVSSATATEAFDLEIPHRFATQPLAWRVVRDGGGIEDAGAAGPTGDALAACTAPTSP